MQNNTFVRQFKATGESELLQKQLVNGATHAI